MQQWESLPLLDSRCSPNGVDAIREMPKGSCATEPAPSYGLGIAVTVIIHHYHHNLIRASSYLKV